MIEGDYEMQYPLVEHRPMNFVTVKAEKIYFKD